MLVWFLFSLSSYCYCCWVSVVWLLLILFSLFSSCCCSRCVLDDAIFWLSLFCCCCCCWVVLCSPCPVGIAPVRFLCCWSSSSAALLIPLFLSVLVLLLFFPAVLTLLLFCCYLFLCCSHDLLLLLFSLHTVSWCLLILLLFCCHLFLCCSHDLLLFLLLLSIHTVPGASLFYCCFVAICSVVVLTTSSSFFSSSPSILFLMPLYSIACLFLCCFYDLFLVLLFSLHTVPDAFLCYCCFVAICSFVVLTTSSSFSSSSPSIRFPDASLFYCCFVPLLLSRSSLPPLPPYCSWCLLIRLLFCSYLFLCCSYDLLLLSLHTVSWCCFVSLVQVHVQLVSGWGVGHDEAPSADPQLGSRRLRDVPPLPPPCAHPPARRSAPLGALPRADGRTFRVRRHLLAEGQGRDGAAPRSSRFGIPSSWADVSQKRVRGFFCGFSLRGVFRECSFLVLPRSGSKSWDFYRSLLRISDGGGKNAEQLESRETVRHLRFVRPRQSRQRPQPACGRSNRPSGVRVGCRGRASASETSAVTPWREIPSRAIHLTDEGAHVHPGPHQIRSAGCRLPKNPCSLRQCRLPTHVPVRSEGSSERSGGQQLPGASHGRPHASLHLAPGTDSSRIPAEQNHQVWPVHGPA